MKKLTIENILLTRHYLVSQNTENVENSAYFNAFLLANFGIIVDKPQLLTKVMVEQIADVFKLDIPSSFYENPQDTKYFSRTELLIEQLVSYFLVETGTGIYSRVELFEKDLPEYKVGNEIKLREFKIISADEVKSVLTEICDAYCSYTRPFGVDELAEFEFLFDNGFYSGKGIKCRDNVFSILKRNINAARFLDKKDLVKLSVSTFGEQKKLSFSDKDTLDLIAKCLPLVHDCPMSKKQAKYFNKLVSVCNSKVAKVTNEKSPYRLAKVELDKGNVLEAAKIYAKNGSLFERNIKFLLSRANPIEAVKIIEMLPAKNPIALYQMVSALSSDNDSRTFTFYHNNCLKNHKETAYEATWRKSKLNDSTKKLLHDVALEKIKDYYSSLDKLGKVYISDAFYKLGVPTNTSASGKGIDVIPTGSRILCPYNNIRTFVYWKNVYDIDASLTLIDNKNRINFIYFGNYATKPYGTSILFSGDNRDKDGAEYYDIKLDELVEKGYKYVLYTLNGFNGSLDEGEIYCGYQNKDNLETKAWDPKNIELQFKVFGKSHSSIAFGIDLATKEIVVLNLVEESNARVVTADTMKVVEKYLVSSFLELNMGLIASYRGEVVATPEEADVVFDDSYQPTETQKVVRTFELEKLVSLVNSNN